MPTPPWPAGTWARARPSAGNRLSYEQGDIVAARILSVVPDGAPDTWAADRQAVIQQAVERSEAQDMARLALIVAVKWCSYDPDGILPGGES